MCCCNKWFPDLDCEEGWWRSTGAKEGWGTKVVIWLPTYHLQQLRLCFQLLCYSSLPYSSPGGFHSIAIITKVTMPKWGQLTVSPLFFLHFNFWYLHFFQFYICSRFIASLLCLIKCWSWLSQAIITSKPTNKATLFDWREEICLCSGREIMTTSYSHLGCISRVSSSATIKMLWLAYLGVVNNQVEGEQVLISSSLSPDKVRWLPDKSQYPITNRHRLEVKLLSCSSPCAQSGMLELSGRLPFQPLALLSHCHAWKSQ